MTAVQDVKIPALHKAAYGAGNLTTGIAMQILGTYLVFYATAILRLPGSFIGLMMGGSILWDAVTDPVMGYFSDRTRSERLGRRHPYLLAGAAGIALTNHLIWNLDPSLGTGIKFLSITIYVILFKTFMTMYVTPYTALGAELSVDYRERTSIQSIKAVFFILGLAYVSVVGMSVFFRPSDLYPVGQLNPRAYAYMGTAGSITIMAAALCCFFPTLRYVPVIRARDRAAGETAGGTFFRTLLRTFHNIPYRMVVLAYMFSNIASALLANLGLIVFTYTFGLGGERIAMIIGVQFLFAALSQPLWTAMAAGWGKMQALVAGFLFGIAGSGWFAFLVIIHETVQGNIAFFLPFAVCAGIGVGALVTLPLSMVADTVDLDEAEGGIRNEGVYFGSLTLVYKLSQAVVIVLIGTMLDLTGFDPFLPRQEASTLISLGLILGIGGMASFGTAIFCLRGYELDEPAVAECRRRIESHRKNTRAL